MNNFLTSTTENTGNGVTSCSRPVVLNLSYQKHSTDAAKLEIGIDYGVSDYTALDIGK
jgi:hypothetical protein